MYTVRIVTFPVTHYPLTRLKKQGPAQSKRELHIYYNETHAEKQRVYNQNTQVTIP
jgi:hypothetical protein